MFDQYIIEMLTFYLYNHVHQARSYHYAKKPWLAHNFAKN